MKIRFLLASVLFFVWNACFAIASIDPLSLNMKVNADSSCTEYKVVGACMKGPLNVGALVRMYVPVAFIETVGAPGDSLMAVPNFYSLIKSASGLDAFSVGQSNNSGMDNSWEAKVWTFPDSVMTWSKIMPKCLVCMPSDAVDLTVKAPAPPSLGCDLASGVASKVLSLTSSINLPLMPKLVYASELDPINWRTGCRDVSLTNILQSNAFTCSVSALAGNASSLLGSSNPISKYFEGDLCLGAWGALMPRQMRDVGNVATVASAKTAYRALSVAKTQLMPPNNVRFAVDTKGKLQQAYPAVSACFKPGASPLPMLPTSSKPVVVSPDGAYGWIYWQTVTCCVTFTNLQKCLKTN